MLDSLKMIFYSALEPINSENKDDLDYLTIMRVTEIVQILINSEFTDLSLKFFSEQHWKFTFKALEYSENNFDIQSKQMKYSYVEFCEN